MTKVVERAERGSKSQERNVVYEEVRLVVRSVRTSFVGHWNSVQGCVVVLCLYAPCVLVVRPSAISSQADLRSMRRVCFHKCRRTFRLVVLIVVIAQISMRIIVSYSSSFLTSMLRVSLIANRLNALAHACVEREVACPP